MTVTRISHASTPAKAPTNLPTEKAMKPAALSVLVFGIYLAVTGILLLAVPDQTCRWIGLRPPGDSMWARLSGALFLDLAYYCIQAARSGQQTFIRWTAMTRPWTIVVLGLFVVLQLENPVVLILGIVDLAAAAWTTLALRVESRRQPPDSS